MKICIFGGLFGSEGKGCVSEFIAKSKRTKGSKLIVFGENSPNSGHTCSAGKTRNVPAGAFYADGVVLGPDAVIDVDILTSDIEQINLWRLKNGYGPIEVYLHEHCGITLPDDKMKEDSVVSRVSSTGSGSGAARFIKQFHREEDRTLVGNVKISGMLKSIGYRILTRYQWFTFIHSIRTHDWIFECSQGALLDTNWGYFPFVTSRTTLPRTAIDRNGLSGFSWEYAGVYRTFPIRTGGPSGPTGGSEISWSNLNVEDEIATVTKRTRRVFCPSADDLFLSFQLTHPHHAYFTHCDYIEGVGKDPRPDQLVEGFINHVDDWLLDMSRYPMNELYISSEASQFLYVPLAAIRTS